eukprot:gene18395-biopygen3936
MTVSPPALLLIEFSDRHPAGIQGRGLRTMLADMGEGDFRSPRSFYRTAPHHSGRYDVAWEQKRTRTGRGPRHSTLEKRTPPGGSSGSSNGRNESGRGPDAGGAVSPKMHRIASHRIASFHTHVSWHAPGRGSPSISTYPSPIAFHICKNGAQLVSTSAAACAKTSIATLQSHGKPGVRTSSHDVPLRVVAVS